MPDPTQAVFAKLLTEAMERGQVTTSDLSAATGVDRTTIARWRHPGYESGPPRDAMRRVLERALELPPGHLDGPPTIRLI